LQQLSAKAFFHPARMHAMFAATLLFAAALQQCGRYSGPADGTIHVCGHSYKLVCTRSGSPSECTASAVGPAEVDHFEVRDEQGRVVFERSGSREQLFTGIGVSASGYPDHPQLFTVSVERQTRANDRVSSISYTYYFDATPSGLTAFQPALSCGEGTGTMLSNQNLWPPGGMAVGCELDAGYFRFTAELVFDWDSHRIVPTPTAGRTFHVGSSAELSAKATAVSTLRVYRDHDKNAPQATIPIARGQATRLGAAWVPILLRTSGDVAIATYDPEELWLQLKLKDRTGWIRGSESFRDVGLHEDAVR
jgi:hypothetical protein